jgi:hypothetical protein
VQANVYWQSNSVANVVLQTYTGQYGMGTLFTGLTTTNAGSLWFEGTMTVSGTATATIQFTQSQICQVH